MGERKILHAYTFNNINDAFANICVEYLRFLFNTGNLSPPEFGLTLGSSLRHLNRIFFNYTLPSSNSQ